MPLEIEAKMRLVNPQALEQRLRSAGARLLSDVLTTETYFDAEDDRLRRGDCGLRLRQCRPAEFDRSDSRLTYKGPRESAAFKQREEIELLVSSSEEAAQLLDRLGYRPKIRFQKHRRTWQLGDCRVELDRLPHLGKFVEIEGPSSQAIQKIREELGLADTPLLDEPYVAMIAEYCRANNLDSRHVVFPDDPPGAAQARST